MTMTAHTPGPWQAATIEGDDYAFVEPADNSTDNDNANYVIARCSGPDRINNAILIAAAPDLLKLVKDIANLDHYCLAHGDKTLINDLRAWKMEARAAIAKAEGTT